MKSNRKSKLFIIAIISFSIFSAVFLEMQDVDIDQLVAESDFADIYINDSSYLPDVKIVKEVLKSIFNVVRS
jgi:hypothetical protein